MSDGLKVDVELLTDEINEEISPAADAPTGTGQWDSLTVLKHAAWFVALGVCSVLTFQPVQNLTNALRTPVATVGNAQQPLSIGLHEVESRPAVITGGDRPEESSQFDRGVLQKAVTGGDSAQGTRSRGMRIDIGGAPQQKLATNFKPNGIQLEQVDAAPGKTKLDTGTDLTRMVVPVSEGRMLRFDEDVDSVFIADPSVADVKVVTPTQIYVFGKRSGETNILAVSSNKRAAGEPGISASLKVYVSTAPQANEAMGASPYFFRFQNNRLFMEGHGNIDQGVRGYESARSYANQDPVDMATLEGSNQVNIRVRFVEVSRADMQSLGVDWNFSVQGGSFSLGIAKTSSDGLSPNLSAKGGVGNFTNINVMIEALQKNGMVNILAEPNLTAVTGETASFLAGGEVPIPVATGNAANSLSVMYKSFGVSLQFTPTIIRKNRIALRVKPEVSSISGTTNFGINGVAMPSFSVRRTETVVEVASGQTFAIAGLFSRDMSRSVEKFPLLGDLPVLGTLFQSERYKRNETELVILITPYLVSPTSDKMLATPLDRQNQPAPPLDRQTPPARERKEVLREKSVSTTDDNLSGFVFK